MSLTSIMKGGFSKVIVANFPIPRNRFEPSKSCIACPRTSNYSLIGTAFDYLFRSEIKRVHPDAKEGTLIAEASISLVRQSINRNGIFLARSGQIGGRELSAMVSVADLYRNERESFLASGSLSNKYLETTIRFARMDAVFRAATYDDVEKDVDAKDIEDMKALYDLIPEYFKNIQGQILLDPDFGKVSRIVGGADVDMIIGDTMIDIKTTKEMKLDDYVWSQLVGYLILSDEAHKVNGSFPIIEKLGIYFSRFGRLWLIGADYARNNSNYNSVSKQLLDLGAKLFGN